MSSQSLKIDQLVKQSSRREAELILVEMAETVNAHQDINSQRLKIGQLVKQSSRKREKIIIVEMAESVNTHRK